MDRHAAVSRVLYRVLLLNLIVAVAKIALGYVSGAISVLSDGFHSLTDTVSNIVGLIGVKISSRPPDVDHPYGHRKFETMASVGILVFLLIVLVQVLWSAAERLQSGGAPTEAVRLSSEVLVSDAYHTQSDLLTSATVIAALLAVRAGYPLLDPIAAIVVAVFIGHACWGILKETSRILADQIVIDPEDIQAVVRSVPEVLGCHQIRSRGSTDHVFVDLHVWMDPGMRLDEAHRVSHVVKDRIMAKYPQIKDAVIHLEPPPSELRTKN